MELRNSIILIGKANSHNNLLSDYLSNNLDSGCSCFEIEKIDLICNDILKNHSLILIDSVGLQANSLVDIIDVLSLSCESSKVAFFNVDTNFPCNKLLFWPYVRGVFFDDADENNILNGIKDIIAGKYWLPRKVTEQFLVHLHRTSEISHTPVDRLSRHESMAQLTKRERHILKSICEGSSNNEIATDLKVSLSTVKTHAYNLFKKLNVSNRTQAANVVRKLTASNS